MELLIPQLVNLARLPDQLVYFAIYEGGYVSMAAQLRVKRMAQEKQNAASARHPYFPIHFLKSVARSRLTSTSSSVAGLRVSLSLLLK